jgi:hypothetical protein
MVTYETSFQDAEKYTVYSEANNLVVAISFLPELRKFLFDVREWSNTF